MEKRGGEKKTKEKNREEEGQGTVMGGQTEFFISACEMFSPGYLPLGSFNLFFLIILFSSSTSLGAYFASSALTPQLVGLTEVRCGCFWPLSLALKCRTQLSAAEDEVNDRNCRWLSTNSSLQFASSSSSLVSVIQTFEVQHLWLGNTYLNHCLLLELTAQHLCCGCPSLLPPSAPSGSAKC